MEDDLDYRASRGEAARLMERIKDAIDKNLQYEGLKDKDREKLSATAKPIFYAYEELAERFIEPHATTNQAVARHGYVLLLVLMANSFSAGGLLIDTAGQELELFTKRHQRLQHRARSSNGGKTNSIGRRNKQAEQWGDKGLSIAKKYVATNPGYSQDSLATEIKFKLDDMAATHGQIKNVISTWQRDKLIPKPYRKTGEARFARQSKHAS
jgi:hypothetical protein